MSPRGIGAWVLGRAYDLMRANAGRSRSLLENLKRAIEGER